MSKRSSSKPPVKPNAEPVAPPPGFAGDHVFKAIAHLRQAHPTFRDTIVRVGPFEPKLTLNPFHALVGSIIHQQVSMAAARSMQRKLTAHCPRGRITAESLLTLTEEQYRSSGISRQKRGYLLDIAERFASGSIQPRTLKKMTDEQVIESVTAIKGVGRWTAEMLLIFSLQRWDVWPVGDLGLRRALERVHNKGREFRKKERYVEHGEALRPYRSVATWYLWRSLDKPIQPAITD